MKKHGFTLVEFAVVLVVIGIALAAVLKGEELIMNARIKAVIAEVQGFSSAYNRFYEKYESLPGDSAIATDEIPGCSVVNNCANGDGEFQIGSAGDAETDLWAWLDQTGYTTSSDGLWADFLADKRETTQFWKHLTLSGFIVGVDPAAPLEPARWGVTHPTAALDGAGYQVLFMNSNDLTGHFLRLQKSVSGWDPLTSEGRKPLMSISPKWAWVIDRKIDDGYGGQSGNIWSAGVETPDGGTYCSGSYVEDIQQTQDDVCILMFRID